MNLFDSLKSLATRGLAAVSEPEPVVVETPAPEPAVVPQEQAAIPETFLEGHLKNVAAAETAPVEVIPVSAAPAVVLDEDGLDPCRPIDWDGEEKRTDLPQRTVARIRYLLKFESEAQTKARIQNDRERHLVRHRPFTQVTDKVPNRNPQAHIISPDSTAPSVGTWKV